MLLFKFIYRAFTLSQMVKNFRHDKKSKYTNPTPTSGPKKNEKKTFANATQITGSSEIVFVHFLSGIIHFSTSTLV